MISDEKLEEDPPGVHRVMFPARHTWAVLKAIDKALADLRGGMPEWCDDDLEGMTLVQVLAPVRRGGADGKG